LEFTVSGSQLVAAFLPKEEGDISFPMTYDPATMTATYESADESLIRSFTVTFYEAGGNMCMGAVMQDDYPYSDIPSGTYYLNGARDYPQ
ncbi:MAG: hypothetical protein IKI63_01925, partial [Clostridia bacterium]|nr:hypothetical protein [Clostridia bacterium]